MSSNTDFRARLWAKRAALLWLQKVFAVQLVAPDIHCIAPSFSYVL